MGSLPRRPTDRFPSAPKGTEGSPSTGPARPMLALRVAAIVVSSSSARRLAAASPRIGSSRSSRLALSHLATACLLSLPPRCRLAGTPPPLPATPRHASPRLATPRLDTASSRLTTPHRASPRHATSRRASSRHAHHASPPPCLRFATPRHASPRLATPHHASSHLTTPRQSVSQPLPANSGRDRSKTKIPPYKILTSRYMYRKSGHCHCCRP